MDIKQEAEKYYNNLAPHVKQREGAKHIVNLLKELEATERKLAEADSLLSVAICPSCDGSGAVVVDGVGCEAGCCGNLLPSGECCGNPVAVQVQTQELSPCQWCDEKQRFVSDYEASKGE